MPRRRSRQLQRLSAPCHRASPQPSRRQAPRRKASRPRQRQSCSPIPVPRIRQPRCWPGRQRAARPRFTRAASSTFSPRFSTTGCSTRCARAKVRATAPTCQQQLARLHARRRQLRRHVAAQARRASIASIALARQIAADLASKPVTADELLRTVGPMRQSIARASSGNSFWLQQLQARLHRAPAPAIADHAVERLCPHHARGIAGLRQALAAHPTRAFQWSWSPETKP